MPTIFSIYQDLVKYEKSIIEVKGWVKSIRKGKDIYFIVLNDGSTIENLQVVFHLPDHIKVKKLEKINFASSLIVKGKLALTPQRKQVCELEGEEIIFSNITDDDYPLQKKTLLLKEVRKYPHLRAKTNYFLIIFRLRSSLTLAVHNFFQTEGFYYIHTPLIISNDTEGAGELFNLSTSNNEKFFGKPAKLTVSGQLQAEALAQGLGKVYTFSPCFRAEKSNTTRHLAEFLMLEPEIAFGNFQDTLELAEKLVKYLINHALHNNYKELEVLEDKNKKEIINKLKNIIIQPFQKITYTQAIEIIEKNKKNFIYKDIYWGIDLQSEHEKYLTQYFDKPIFVVDYPAEIKAFYMKNNNDNKTVASFDLLLPEIGELIGGSMREDNYFTLEEKAKKTGLNIDNLSWYLKLRRYGYAPSAGFGLGFERLLMFITSTENIRDTIAFPNYSEHLEF